MKEFARSLFYLFIGVLLALALGEFMLSKFFLVDPPPGMFRANPNRAFEHHPGFRGRDRVGNPIRINSMGLRDREYSLDKPADVYRILVLGDSVAFGDAIRSEDTFPKKLEQLLNQGGLPKKVEVLNSGVRGYNTYQELWLLKEVGLKYRPDLILLAYVTNDAEPFSKQAGLIDKNKAWLIHLKNFVKEHSYLYAFFRKNFEILRHQVTPQKFAQTYNEQFAPDSEGWKASYASLREMRDIAKNENCSFLLTVFPRIEGLGEGEIPASQKIYEQILEAGRSLGINTLGILPAWKGHDAAELKVAPGDAFHPNPKGNEMVARFLNDYIRSRYFNPSEKALS